MNSRALKKHLRYMITQLRLALIKEPSAPPRRIYCPADIEKFVEPLVFNVEEQFVAFHLDCKSQVIGYQIISHGTLTSIIPS